MRAFHPPSHPLRQISANDDVEPLRSLEQSLEGRAWPAESRHEPQALTTRIVPVDPYTAWLTERESERERSRFP
jgi:hypothetical protein